MAILKTFVFQTLLALLLLSAVELAAQVGENTKTAFEEKNGFLNVEAENFEKQTETAIRQWYKIGADKTENLRDIDTPHNNSASGKMYLEILPDTRTNHDEKLIVGENFSNEPGKLAILHYPVKVNSPGRYYIWVSAYSSGTEDNGVHVGLNDLWPESGQRMQWCDGKDSWYWESKQRTKEEHCGVPYRIYLDIDKPGLYDIQFSMREDGFEMDQWLMTNDIDFNPREL